MAWADMFIGRLLCHEGRVSSLNKSNPIKSDMFMSYMYCFVIKKISLLHIDYQGRDLLPWWLSSWLRGPHSDDVSSCSVFTIHACHWNEGIVVLAGFSPLDSLEDVCLTISSVSGGESHGGMTTFSFQWITTELLMKLIYWYLKRYPFLW